jgi:uncharacterized membrane protein
MAHWLSLWGIAAALFLFMDMIWLLRVGQQFYRTEIGSLLRDRPNLAVACLFYVVYISGLVTFVIEPYHQAASASGAFVWGALFGLVAYGTFNFTNLAILKGFTTRIAAIDLSWGMIVTGTTAALTVAVGQLLSA